MPHQLSAQSVEKVDLPDDGDSEHKFSSLLRYFREPFDPCDPESFDRRAAMLEELQADLRDRMTNLEQKRKELARVSNNEREGGGGFGEENEDEDEDIPNGTEAGDDDAMGGLEFEGAEEPAHGHEQERGCRPPKPRRPYTITCALWRTNWFESSLEWEDEDFRSTYRLVSA
jgi:hypothetical protein